MNAPTLSVPIPLKVFGLLPEALVDQLDNSLFDLKRSFQLMLDHSQTTLGIGRIIQPNRYHILIIAYESWDELSTKQQELIQSRISLLILVPLSSNQLDLGDKRDFIVSMLTWRSSLSSEGILSFFSDFFTQLTLQAPITTAVSNAWQMTVDSNIDYELSLLRPDGNIWPMKKGKDTAMDDNKSKVTDTRIPEPQSSHHMIEINNSSIGVINQSPGEVNINQTFSQAPQSDNKQDLPLSQSNLPVEKLMRLHTILNYYFNEEELRTLCFQLNVKYDGLAGSGMTAKARELVEYLDRRERIPELVQLIKELRPKVHLDFPNP